MVREAEERGPRTLPDGASETRAAQARKRLKGEVDGGLQGGRPGRIRPGRDSMRYHT